MAFIHLMLPQKSFTKRIINLFEEANPNNNVFCVFGSKSDELSDESNISLYSKSQNELFRFIDSQKNVEGIILHGILIKIENLISRLPSNIRVAWYYWGYEPFEANWKLDVKNYFPETRKVVKQTSPFYWYRRFNPIYRLPRRPFNKVFDRIDICVSYIYDEYEFLLRNKVITPHTKWMPGNIGYWEQVVDMNESFPNLGNNILVGNSAHYTNNHIEAFKAISQHKLTGLKVIVPLSYGNKRNKKKVLSKGKEILGDSFNPLHKFIPLNEYKKLINSCGVYIMNHKRQQALGNINIGLWNGAKVFLNNTTLYQNYIKKGFNLFLIDKIKNIETKELLTELHIKQKINNRALIKKYLSKEVIVSQTKDLIKEMNK